MLDSIASLVAFLKRFHRHWLEEPALDPSLIPADLPDGLATIYRELGGLVEIEQGPENDWRAPFATQDALMPLSRLKRIGGMVEFAWENQGNWSCRCRLGESDPAVYSNAPDLWNEERAGFVVICNSLNQFLIALCLQEAVMSCRNLVTVRGDQEPTQVVAGELLPLWLHGQYMYATPLNFFVSGDQEVLVMDSDVVWIGSSVRSGKDFVVPGVHFRVLSGA